MKKSYQVLVNQAIDSTKFYGGDCLKITFYDESETAQFKIKQGWQNYLVFSHQNR